jgi:hypothetical protein
MLINEKSLREADGKLMFLIAEQWQGLSPTASYADQAAAVSRALDSVEYIERAVERGTVSMAHKNALAASTVQLLSVSSMEELNEYLKVNEAHARLPQINRVVLPLSDWDQGRKVFDKMLARAEVRAAYEAKGESQPSQDRLDREAEELLAKSR